MSTEKGIESDAVDARERWSSRAAFYFAAVGSAVGYGNVWRFPSLVYEFGGGAFFIPYLCALFFIGIPILALEISLGQFYETGDVGVFGSIHARLRGVGMSSIACGYMLVTYYSMLLAWTLNAFFDSFGSDNFWTQEQVTGAEAKAYFYDSIIGMSSLGPDLRPTRIIGKNVGYSFLAWVVIYLCVCFGVKTTGRITYFTMGFPIVLLFLFLGRSVTLEGAQAGIDEYLNSNWEVLTERPEVWSRAVSQIFFSIGITFGIMTAYGSYCKKGEPAFVNSCVVAISNCLFSFIAGFAVFATLGYLATIAEAESVSELQFASFGLVFGSWPVALGTLPGGPHWIRLFFFMLFLLGIDSAFSFVEGFLTVLQDTKLFCKVPRKISTGVLAIVAFLFSLMYATDAGLIFLDAVDYYINFVMLLVGCFECFAVGFIYRIEDQIASLGAEVVFSYITTTFGSVIIACVLWFGIGNADTALWAGFVGLILCYTIGMAFVTYLMRKKTGPERSLRSMYYELYMGNIMQLREDLREDCGNLPVAWAVLVKHFIPQILLVLFALGANAERLDADGNSVKVFGHYEGYVAWPYQVLGILTVVFAGFLFVSSLAFPRLYAALDMPNKERDLKRVFASPKATEMVVKGSTENHGADDDGVPIDLEKTNTQAADENEYPNTSGSAEEHIA